jgi:tripartite-type tricarboxylate transporter receptor subunit TctC
MKIRVALAGLLMALATVAVAQVWPTQTIKIIVPFTPGTGMDTIARTVAPKLSERLGKPVVVHNVPGASGNIGADNVARASPDGYTMLMGANTMLMAAQLYKNVPFNPVDDFASVSMTAYGTLMLVASPKSGIKSMQELIALAKAKPGFVNFGSPGIGTPHHMAMELFKSEAQITVLHVPYKGTSGFVQDLLAGELMVGFLPVHVAQNFVSSGKLIALAVGGAARHPVAPDVATIQELGVSGVNVDIWYAFFVPAKVPPAVINRLNTEIAAIMKLPEVRSVLTNAGLDAMSSTSNELDALLRKDYLRWGSVIKRNAIEIE